MDCRWPGPRSWANPGHTRPCDLARVHPGLGPRVARIKMNRQCPLSSRILHCSVFSKQARHLHPNGPLRPRRPPIPLRRRGPHQQHRPHRAVVRRSRYSSCRDNRGNCRRRGAASHFHARHIGRIADSIGCLPMGNKRIHLLYRQCDFGVQLMSRVPRALAIVTMIIGAACVALSFVFFLTEWGSTRDALGVGSVGVGLFVILYLSARE